VSSFYHSIREWPLRRGVRRSCERLPWDLPLREGPAQTEGVGGAVVQRSQGLAQYEEVQAQGAPEGERGGAFDRRRPERQATTRLWREEAEATRAGRPPFTRAIELGRTVPGTPGGRGGLFSTSCQA